MEYYDEVLQFSDSTYEENLKKLGYVNLDSPDSINLYAASFEDKDVIEEAISDYNSGREELEQISYTDYVGLMMRSVTTIINAITYVLIAFVAVSLVVSSIMIGVITLISVQERTKEIGILRAIGASKANVSSMFNAETAIIGFIQLRLVGVVGGHGEAGGGDGVIKAHLALVQSILGQGLYGIQGLGLPGLAAHHGGSLVSDVLHGVSRQQGLLIHDHDEGHLVTGFIAGGSLLLGEGGGGGLELGQVLGRCCGFCRIVRGISAVGESAGSCGSVGQRQGSVQGAAGRCR